MYKRYLTVLVFFATLVGCFFLFFDKPTNKELYKECYEKLDKISNYNNLSDNEDLHIVIDSEYISNQYHYVATFTSTKTLNNFKALVLPNENRSAEYYPTFGIFDNENINLVDSDAKEGETKGVNLVVSNREKIKAFKIYVSYNNCEYFYLINVEE